MPSMLILEKEMIRINPKNAARLEVSTNQGRSWHTLFWNFMWGFSGLSE